MMDFTFDFCRHFHDASDTEASRHYFFNRSCSDSHSHLNCKNIIITYILVLLVYAFILFFFEQVNEKSLV